MVEHPMSRLKRVNAGDAAVDGLLAGLVAGLVKGLFLVLAGVLAGGAWRDVLIQLDPQGSSVLRGLLAHFAVAGIYGTIFGVVASRFRRVRPGWLAGLVYSLFVLLFAWFVLLPVAAPALREVGVLTWAIGHMIYGLLLGTLAASSESAGSRLSSR